MKVRSYRELDVWKKALDLVQRVYTSSREFPAEERFGITSQLRRAAVSVPSNIAEGAERPGKREFLHYLGVARGSLGELETLALIAQRLGYVSGRAAEELLKDADEIGRMLRGLRRALDQGGS